MVFALEHKGQEFELQLYKNSEGYSSELVSSNLNDGKCRVLSVVVVE